MTSKEAIEKIKHLLFGSEKFSSIKTKDGVEMKVEGDVELGKKLYVVTPEGELPAPEDTFEFEDGMKLIIGEDGEITKIDYIEPIEVEEEVMEENEDEKEEEVMEEEVEVEEEVKMVTAELIDGTIVETDSEELKIGDKIQVKTEEGLTDAPDAIHETVDGKLIETVDSVIVKIEEKEVVEEELSEEVDFNEMLEVFTAGFNHLNTELELMREKYDTLQENFQKFSAEPAGERVRTHREEYIEMLNKNKFSRIEQLKALKSKNK